MINTVDEDGNNIELGGEFPLEENEHFNNLPVNTQQSDIQIPTNVYNKGQRSTLNIWNDQWSAAFPSAIGYMQYNMYAPGYKDNNIL